MTGEEDGNGGAAVQVAEGSAQTDLGDRVNSLGNLDADALLSRSKQFRSECARASTHRNYTPSQTLDKLESLDQKMDLIGTPFEGMDITDMGFFQKIGLFIYKHLPQQMRTSGRSLIDDKREGYNQSKTGLEAEIHDMDSKLNSDAIGSDDVPIGLYARLDHYESIMREAATSAVEAKKFKDEVYARLKETEAELKGAKHKDQKERLSKLRFALREEYNSLRDQYISEDNRCSQAENYHKDTAREITDIEAQQERSYARLQLLNTSAHSDAHSYIGSIAEGVITNASLAEVQADESLGQLKEVVSKANDIALEKRDALERMVSNTTIRPDVDATIRPLSMASGPDIKKLEQERYEKMVALANYDQ